MWDSFRVEWGISYGYAINVLILYQLSRFTFFKVTVSLPKASKEIDQISSNPLSCHNHNVVKQLHPIVIARSLDLSPEGQFSVQSSLAFFLPPFYPPKFSVQVFLLGFLRSPKFSPGFLLPISHY